MAARGAPGIDLGMRRIRDPWTAALILVLAMTAFYAFLSRRDVAALAECRLGADLDRRAAAERIDALNQTLLMCTVDARRPWATVEAL
mgnify:FL=1